MRKLFCFATLFIVLVAANPNAIFAEITHDFGTVGYFRISAAVSGDSSQEIFMAPGASAKYRLGNENDNYTEISLTDKIMIDPENEKAPYFKVEGMASAYGGPNDKMDWGDFEQFYMEGFNLLPLNAKIWAGRRYYDRQDIHINDYFYLNPLQGGVALGIRDMDIGIGGLSIAYGIDEGTSALNTAVRQNGIDVRADINANKNGVIKLWGYYTFSQDTEEVYGTKGYAAGIGHTQTGIFGGYNKFMVQYGTGLARRAGAMFSLAEPDVANITTEADGDNLEEAKTFRVVNSTVFEDNQNWSMMVGVVYETKDSTDFDGTDQTWISVGARPVKYFTDYFRIPLEVGYDYVKDENADTSGYLLKGTLAAEFALSKGWWSRPVLRLFGTYASWSEDFKGQIGGDAFADDTTGWTIGTQIECWW